MKRFICVLVALSLVLACDVAKVDVAQKYASGVVMLVDEISGSGGTGFLVRAPSGRVLILTNGHVCEMVTHIRLERDVPTSIVEQSTTTDLCLMEIPSVFGAVLPIASHSPNRFAKVQVLGYGGLLPLALTEGLFLGKYGKEALGVLSPDYISAPVLPGNSGSPAFNERGEVIGVVYASSYMLDSRALIVPLSDVQKFLAPY